MKNKIPSDEEHTVFIGIGSNLGDKLKNCQNAMDALSLRDEIKIEKTSAYYETEALGENGPSGQPSFINAVIQISTVLLPHDLLKTTIEIEDAFGRPHPRPKGQPRTVDLDMLFYDDTILETDKLSLPHPGITKRLFVLTPLCDIAPGMMHVVENVTIKELRDKLLASKMEG